MAKREPTKSQIVLQGIRLRLDTARARVKIAAGELAEAQAVEAVLSGTYEELERALARQPGKPRVQSAGKKSSTKGGEKSPTPNTVTGTGDAGTAKAASGD